jgi:hypothetical protein
MQSKLVLKGRYILEVKDVKKNSTIKIEKENILVDVGLDALADKIGEAENNSLFQQIAVGTGNTAPNAADTTLTTEVFRTPPLTVTVVDNVVTVTGKIEFDEANGNTLREIGIFGVNASGTLDSGILISRALISEGYAGPEISKVSGVEINITWELTCSRV